jgi:hypothetical protein
MRMKIYLGYVCWFFLLQAGMAQTIPTCSKVFYDVGVGSGGVNITSLNDSIYFSIYTQDTSNSYQYVDFIKTDSSGIETNRLKIKFPEYEFSTGSQGSLKITSDGFLICGGNSGSTNTTGAFGTFYKINRTSMDTFYIKYYQDRNISDFFGLG